MPARLKLYIFIFDFIIPVWKQIFKNKRETPGVGKEKMAKLRLPIIPDSHKMKRSENIISLSILMVFNGSLRTGEKTGFDERDQESKNFLEADKRQGSSF